MKIRTITFFVLLILSTFFLSAENSSFTKQDCNDAIDAFNDHLLDPERKLYYRDSDKPEKVGAIWTQAIYWDMIMNAYKRTNDTKYKTLMTEFFEGGRRKYSNYNWHDDVEWFIYDDIMWWVISLARAYEITGEEEYLILSESGFERVWSGSTIVGDDGSYADPDRGLGGGMFWQWNQNNPTEIHKSDMGKMSCINYPTVIAAMTLYNATQNVDYLNKAKEIYAWARGNLFDTSLGRVADSKHGDKTPHWKMHTYNQGTCIGAAVMLYNETKESYYKEDAVLATNYTMNKMCDKNGILPYELGEEQGIYNAIFAQYIIRLIEDCDKPEYLPWLRKNIVTGWNNRDSRNLTTHKHSLKHPEGKVISCYDASSIPALMQICPPGSGDLVSEDTIYIRTEANLRAIRNNMSAYYKLENDISLSKNWIPLGSDDNPFHGVFDGNGKVIRNLRYDRAEINNVGFFAVVRTGVIKNLGLENVYLVGKNDVGAVCGLMRGAVVAGCYVTGYIEGNDHVGAIVGGSNGNSGQSSLLNCYAYASVYTRSTQVGGILGTIKDLSLRNSYFVGKVMSSASNSGGIVSLNDGGNLSIIENALSIASDIKGEKAFRILAHDGGKTNILRLKNNYSYDNTLVNGKVPSANNLYIGTKKKHGANKTWEELRSVDFYQTINWDVNNIWKIEDGKFPIFQYQSYPLNIDFLLDLPETLALNQGETHRLSVYTPILKRNITFSSSDTSKATVNEDGLITALRGGEVTITVKTEKDEFCNGIEMFCTVNITGLDGMVDSDFVPKNLKVYSKNGVLNLFSEQAMDITIFDVSGRKIVHIKLNGELRKIPLEEGVYIIESIDSNIRYTFKVINK